MCASLRNVDESLPFVAGMLVSYYNQNFPASVRQSMIERIIFSVYGTQVNWSGRDISFFCKVLTKSSLLRCRSGLI
jgi:hypothetical protein